MALMAAVSTTTWSIGCGETAGGSGVEKKPAPAPPAAKAPEAGSSNGAGASVPAEK